MVLDDQVKEAEHLLLRCVDHQVLALGHVEGQEELSLDALDLRDVLHLIAELANVYFLNRNGLNQRRGIVGVGRGSSAVSAAWLLTRAHRREGAVRCLTVLVEPKISLLLACLRVHALFDRGGEAVFD